MELTQLKYFLAVARAGSFVKAAEDLGITQPSLSQQIKKLEQELGAPLFDRLGRVLRLTRYGDELRPRAESILLAANQARQAVEAVHSPDRGRLAIGVIPTILPYAMVEPLSKFRRENPLVEMIVEELTTDKLVDMLRQGLIDVAILVLPIKQEEIVCSELFREPLLAALPCGHRLENSEAVSLAELTQEPMLLLREGHCLREDVLTACTRAKAEFPQSFETDQLSSILALTAAGFGVSLVPALACGMTRGCRFVATKPKAFRRVGYAQAAGHTALPLQKRFVKYLRDYAWAEMLRAVPQSC